MLKFNLKLLKENRKSYYKHYGKKRTRKGLLMGWAILGGIAFVVLYFGLHWLTDEIIKLFKR